MTELRASNPGHEYEPPALVELGDFRDLTQSGCLFGKQWGGSDGINFMGINVPISNCSS